MNRSFPFQFVPFLRGTVSRRGAIFGAILLSVLLAFEVFNYSTTAFALTDLLGNLKFAGITWATVLAFAFCGIDFAGIARIFTPQRGRDEPTEVWYLFGAWLMAALFNATLTWWGVLSGNHELHFPRQYLNWRSHTYESSAYLCSCDGLVDLRSDHRNILGCRREYFYYGRDPAIGLQAEFVPYFHRVPKPSFRLRLIFVLLPNLPPPLNRLGPLLRPNQLITQLA